MRKAQKKAASLQAWQLGSGSPMEKEMIAQGKMKHLADGTYELITRETPDGKGEIARKGDYFKLDPDGNPYPNGQDFFESRHRHLQDDWYIQESLPVYFWTEGDPVCEEMRYLIDHDLLHINPDKPERYYSAFLWGTDQFAASEDIIIFSSIDRNPNGLIRDINFYFIERSVFERTYVIIPD